MTVARRMARWANKLQYEALPEKTVHEAKRRVIDSIATALGAYRVINFVSEAPDKALILSSSSNASLRSPRTICKAAALSRSSVSRAAIKINSGSLRFIRIT